MHGKRAAPLTSLLDQSLILLQLWMKFEIYINVGRLQLILKQNIFQVSKWCKGFLDWKKATD